MAFHTTNLFKGIPCPHGSNCTLTHCIFSHDLGVSILASTPGALDQSSILGGPAHSSGEDATIPPSKRRRVTYENPADDAPDQADTMRDQLAQARKFADVSADEFKTCTDGASRLKESFRKSIDHDRVETYSVSSTNSTASANNMGRGVSHGGSGESLPERKQKPSTPVKPTNEPRKESLNPRMVPGEPVPYPKRSVLLKYLFEEMKRLNSQSQDSGVEGHVRSHLTEQELIGLCLDEEEMVARGSASIYINVMKNRVASYKKMDLEGWTENVKKALPTKFEQDFPMYTPAVGTDLQPELELLILSRLVADQQPLARFGYVPSPPSDEAAAEAAKAVNLSGNFELCDRCTVRFQVFPQRDEEGRLTSNGPCVFHPNRRVMPPKSRGDTGHREPYYPCCNENIGTKGCTTHPHHVFKTSSPNRMAAVMSFITTPENLNPAVDPLSGTPVNAVTFDCEMGYTTLGMELIRLTAVTWPSGAELIDTLVRPLGTVLDLNSQFSGVWPAHFAHAIPYSHLPVPPKLATGGEEVTRTALPVVESPKAARTMLCRFLTPRTPLLGHGLENDLNIIRLCHPTIVDSILCFPHPRGMPMRYGLKMLAKRHLNRDIQTAGAQGHDSLEDARTTGELILLRVKEEWHKLRAQGYVLQNNTLVKSPTSQKERDDVEAANHGMMQKALSGWGNITHKRKRSGQDGVTNSLDGAATMSMAMALKRLKNHDGNLNQNE